MLASDICAAVDTRMTERASKCANQSHRDHAKPSPASEPSQITRAQFKLSARGQKDEQSDRAVPIVLVLSALCGFERT